MIEKRKAILREALKCKNLKRLNKKTFLNAWKALAFLFPGLHPEGFSEPDSGWTERSKPLEAEAWRRFQSGELSDGDLYQAEEAMKGLNARR